MQETDGNPSQIHAERLNQHCACITLDRTALIRDIGGQLGDSGDEILSSLAWRQFFSNAALFVPQVDIARMQAIVTALERAAQLPDYQRQVMSWAPQTAKVNAGPVGVFMGYDFHLGKAGPRLIEINTNAGGAFLNGLLTPAQQRCCGGAANTEWTKEFDTAVIGQFESEWRAQRGSGRPTRIAIVDDHPSEQYLYPEFRLAQQLFQRHGIDAVILSPGDLKYEAGRLYGEDKQVDMVYNRLVDFGLDAPDHAALRAAWLDGGAVITPNPFSHGLLADKRNLAVLSDQHTLEQWGLDAPAAALLAAAIPPTVLVSSKDAQLLWEQRRQWFFKPVAGHGSKGVYRGSKLTKGTFARILQGGYIAQGFVPPSERVVMVDSERQRLKVDVRLYTYRGNVLLAAARLYQGQTTNFRTPGGGFAPLFILDE